MRTVEFESDDPDETPPEIDLNGVSVSARATNPENPNGETIVTVTIHARDDKAGIQWLSFCLKSPLDRITCQGISSPLFDGIVGKGDQTEWHEFSAVMTLPIGSAPGEWGLSHVSFSDRAGHYGWQSFTELLKFTVDNQR